ncbi:SDR family NAD(P)-dependent oxidoreductase [Pseudomonas sp. TMB3-21]
MSDHHSKVALITGGGSGIGAAAARRFLRGGGSVVVAGRNRDRLNTFVADLPADRVLAHAAAVSQRDACEELVRLTVERFGHLDTLINAAGMNLVGNWKRHQTRTGEPACLRTCTACTMIGRERP